MKDKLIREIADDLIISGGIAGATGALVMEILNFILYGLNFLELRAVDWINLLTKRELATDLLQIITGIIGHLFLGGLTGVVLAYILYYTDYRFPILKGIGAGFSTNISFLILGSLFELEPLIETPTESILILHFTAMLFGGLAGYILNKFHKQINKC